MSVLLLDVCVCVYNAACLLLTCFPYCVLINECPFKEVYHTYVHAYTCLCIHMYCVYPQYTQTFYIEAPYLGLISLVGLCGSGRLIIIIHVCVLGYCCVNFL